MGFRAPQRSSARIGGCTRRRRAGHVQGRVIIEKDPIASSGNDHRRVRHRLEPDGVHIHPRWSFTTAHGAGEGLKGPQGIPDKNSDGSGFDLDTRSTAARGVNCARRRLSESWKGIAAARVKPRSRGRGRVRRTTVVQNVGTLAAPASSEWR